MATRPKRGQRSILWWTIAGVIVATLVAIGIYALVFVGEDPGREGPTVEVILEDEAQFVGLDVQLEGRVIETGDGVFSLGSDDDTRLLVVPRAEEELPPVEGGQRVEAAGTVARTVPERFEDPLVDELSDQPALVADSVSVEGG